MLLSRHRDAEMLAEVAHHMGFECVAARPIAAGRRHCGSCCAQSTLTESDDHARRSARPAPQMAGPIYLGVEARPAAGCWASATIGPGDEHLGPVCDSPALFRSRAVMSPAMRIPPDLDRDGIEHYRRDVERMLIG